MHLSIKISVITALLSLSALSISAQTKKIESLTNAISNSKSEQELADLYYELAESLYRHDFDKGFSNAEKSLAIATKSNYVRGKAQALTSIGTYYFYKGENKKCQSFYRQALAVIGDNKFDDFPIKTYIRLSILYRQQASFDSSWLYLNKVKTLIGSHQESELNASMLASSGILANTMSKNSDALGYLKESFKIRKVLGDSVRLADTWRNIGVVYSSISMYDSAEYCYDQAYQLIRQINDPEIHMLLSLSRGETNFLRGNLDKAIENYNDALSKLKANTYKRHYSFLLYKIGELYESQGAYHAAYDYLFNSLKEFEAINSKQDMARAYSHIGWCYNFQENYVLAFENANKSQEIAIQIGDSSSISQNKNLIGYALYKTKKYDEALSNFSQALAIRKKIKHWWGVSYTLYNSALVYIELGDTNKALELLFESLETDKRIGNKSGMVFTYNELGLLYSKKGSFEKAAFYLGQANEMAKKIPLPTQLMANYKNYIYLNERKGDSRNTIRYFKLYMTLKDSLGNEVNSGAIAKADALFQLQKKASEILLINKENELHQEKINTQQAEISFQKRVIFIVTISLVVLLVLVFIIYRLLKSRTRAKEILNKQNIEIMEQQEEILVQSEELTESNSRLEAVNEELQDKNHEIEMQSEKILEVNVNLEKRVEERTSQLNTAYNELETFFYKTSHDFRRPLTTYLGLVEVAKVSVKDKHAIDLFEKVRETTEGLDSMLIKLQSISNIDSDAKRNEVFFSKLISESVKKFSKQIEEKGMKLIVEGDVAFVNTNEHLCKIFLENMIENSINFSTPINPCLRINTSHAGNSITVIIEDNGQGIPASIQHRIFEMYFRGSDNSKGNGLGLYIAKRAIDKLGGTVTFISRLNEGSSFKITIPN